MAEVLARLLELRDEVALIDPDEDPDGPAGMAASNLLAIHNLLVLESVHGASVAAA